MIHQGCLVSLFEHSLLRLRAISFMFPGNQGRSIEASLQNPMCEVDPPSAQEPRKKAFESQKSSFHPRHFEKQNMSHSSFLLPASGIQMLLPTA
jgi:hypothetical protein